MQKENPYQPPQKTTNGQPLKPKVHHPFSGAIRSCTMVSVLCGFAFLSNVNSIVFKARADNLPGIERWTAAITAITGLLTIGFAILAIGIRNGNTLQHYMAYAVIALAALVMLTALIS